MSARNGLEQTSATRSLQKELARQKLELRSITEKVRANIGFKRCTPSLGQHQPLLQEHRSKPAVRVVVTTCTSRDCRCRSAARHWRRLLNKRIWERRVMRRSRHSRSKQRTSHSSHGHLAVLSRR